MPVGQALKIPILNEISRLRETLLTPQFSFMWEMKFGGLSAPSLSWEGIKKWASEALDFAKAEAYSARVTNLTLPFPTIESTGIRSANSKRYVATGDDIGDFTFTVLEDMSIPFMDYMWDWKGKIIDPSGMYYPPKEYKRTMYVFIQDRNGFPSTMWRVVGTWPKDISELTLSYEENRIVAYDITLSVDYTERVPVPGYKEASAAQRLAGSVAKQFMEPADVMKITQL